MNIFVIIASPSAKKIILHDIDIAMGPDPLKNETN